MKTYIIAVGKKSDSLYYPLIQNYQTRLSDRSVEWRYVTSEHRDTPKEQKQAEARKIISVLPKAAYIILLDETGKLLTNSQLADTLAHCRNSSRDVVFIIGGSYGVDTMLKDRADIVWSLSPLVFPHQLVRLILVEQLYRSMTILDGHPYHH